MQEFLNMGGYARFVWPAYGLGLVVLCWNIWSALHLHRTALERARRRAAIGEDAGQGSR
ncbi:MAG TPA: heme exporter protein CcmD [Steroidobacteraceae bacterium]|nr:heme exporter protein CcmD [Steroidobacteraceae bacterium]